MSNDDENKRPSTNKSSKIPSTDKEKKGQVQYRILQRGQPDEPTATPTTPKKLQQEINAGESTSSTKSQRNRRKLKCLKTNFSFILMQRRSSRTKSYGHNEFSTLFQFDK